MHRQFVLLISLLAALTVAARGEQLSAGQDEHLYQMIMSLTGRGGTAPITAAVPLGGKCGTPELLYVSDYVPQASVRTKLAWTSLLAHRYNAETPDTIGSPSGHFLIHYASTGPHAVRDADVDTDPADGIPDYINRTTEIFDSVWTTEVGNLGFKAPPSDGFYPAGGDSRFDVYILDLSQIGLSGAYGATYPDSTVGEFSQHKTSFMVLDNDYTDPGYDTAYAHAPFKILSVTAAHEFFHVIQFGYDAFEFDIVNDEIRAHWMEQSAVWMEEHTYDDVNDYYSYLPAFFANINSGLQTAPVIYSPEGLHLYEYGAVVWPLYLTTKWGDGIIKRIWEVCEDRKGSNAFSQAFPYAISEFSEESYTFATALSEFYVWDYFVGSRARSGFGYEEAHDWSRQVDTIPSSRYMLTYDEYPVDFNQPTFKRFPDCLGGYYIRLSGFPRLDSTLTIKFKGVKSRNSQVITWNDRIVAYDPQLSAPPYIDPAFYPDSFSKELTLVKDYNEALLVLSPYTDVRANAEILKALFFSFDVTDTSNAVLNVVVSDPYPNPYVVADAPDHKLFLDVTQPEPQPVEIQVFTLAGEKLAERNFEVDGNFAVVEWDGRNDDGKEVVSGMYLLLVKAGGQTKVHKVALVR